MLKQDTDTAQNASVFRAVRNNNTMYRSHPVLIGVKEGSFVLLFLLSSERTPRDPDGDHITTVQQVIIVVYLRRLRVHLCMRLIRRFGNAAELMTHDTHILANTHVEPDCSFR